MEKFPTGTDALIEAAKRKARENGLLGLTAEDHARIGSTPPQELSDNPGKTLADLWSDEDIADWLAKERQALEDLSDHPDLQDRMRKNIEVSEQYLRSIGRSI